MIFLRRLPATHAETFDHPPAPAIVQRGTFLMPLPLPVGFPCCRKKTPIGSEEGIFLSMRGGLGNITYELVAG